MHLVRGVVYSSAAARRPHEQSAQRPTDVSVRAAVRLPTGGGRTQGDVYRVAGPGRRPADDDGDRESAGARPGAVAGDRRRRCRCHRRDGRRRDAVPLPGGQARRRESTGNVGSRQQAGVGHDGDTPRRC